MVPTKEQCIQHIQNTVDLLNNFEKWEDIAFVKALSLGIQGKKREARLEGITDKNIKNFFQSDAFDFLTTEIYPHEANVHFPAVNNIDDFLTEYRKGLWEMYWKLMEAKNIFIVPLCLDDYAHPLKERALCIKKAIVDLNRKIKRWNDMKQYGTPLHDLFIYETTEYNNHDEAEKHEHKLGYKY